MNSSQLENVQLDKNGCSLLNQGHVSFHESFVKTSPAGIRPGELVKVTSEDNLFLGIGYFNSNSRIPLRILTKDDRLPNKQFWLESITSALAYRTSFYTKNDSFRVVYGESDYLPGLIVDKFGDYLSVQITTAGLDAFCECILDVLEDVFSPEAIVLACDSLPRKKEGLPLFRKTARGHLPDTPVAIVDEIDHAINLLNGHKTGFFLDHRMNRKHAAGLCKDKQVLDIFCYSGAFGIRAALSGAASVTCVDLFKPALQFGCYTAEHHQLDISFENEEAFAFLKTHRLKSKWDVIFLDPPSFVRGHQRARRNLSNYRKLMCLAAENLSSGGILVSSCCSFHVNRDTFLQLTAEAFSQANRQCRIFHFGSQSPDHPVHPAVEGADYLKCFFIKTDS